MLLMTKMITGNKCLLQIVNLYFYISSKYKDVDENGKLNSIYNYRTAAIRIDKKN